MKPTANTRAQQFYSTHLLPNLEEWRRNRLNERLAMNAVLSLYHIADYYWHDYSSINPARVFEKRAANMFRSELAKRESEFWLIRDIAEAHKHVELTQGVRTVSRAAQTKTGKMAWGEGAWGEFTWGGEPQIIVQLDNGEKRDFGAIAENVLTMWDEMLSLEG